MALKEYAWRGTTWQFEEGKQPADAVEVAAAKPKAQPKARRTANKARAAQGKEQ